MLNKEMQEVFDITNYIVDLDQFKIIKKNKWRGSCGYISIIKDKSNNIQYVAKVIKNSLNNASIQKDFFNHLKIEHLLRGYPNIVNLIGFNLSNFIDIDSTINPTIIFEYVSNGTINQYLCKAKNKSLSNTKKQICMIGIAIGALIMHKKGIVHLDLKPSNILLDENFYPKIGDFGSAQFLQQQIQKDEKDDDKLDDYFPSSDVSAPLYTSPEIIKLISFDDKSDVYSYAYILYKIISEVEPRIESSSILEMFDLILKGKRPDLSVIQKVQKNINETSLQIDKLENLFFTEEDIDDFDDDSDGFTKLISECWDQDPKKRPNFIEIINRLLTDRKLLLPNVDIEEIDNYLKKFDDIKIISTDDESNQFHFRTNYNSKALTTQKKGKSTKKLNKHDIKNYEDLDELCKRQIEVALETGDIESCATVGYNLANGFNGFPQCINEAVKYLQIAIEGGNPSAMNTYATLLMQKSSTTQSESLKEKRSNAAKKLYKIAADLGNTFAMMSYSKILYQEYNGDKKTKKIEKLPSSSQKKNFKRTLSSSAAILLDPSFSSAIYSRSKSTPIKPSNDDDEEEKDNKNSSKNEDNDEINISENYKNSNSEEDDDDYDYNDFTENDIEINSDLNNKQEFEEEEEEADDNDYSANNSKKITTTNSSCYNDYSESEEISLNESKWNESKRYMKLAADSENIIAITLYNEMFGNDEENQGIKKTFSKSMYTSSKNKLDKE